MEAVETVLPLPQGRPFTRADLESVPDDGHRYEIIDGVLIVSPAPNRWHQRVVRELILLLGPNVPADLELLSAPFDVAVSDETVIQPDLIVASQADFTDRELPVAPLLAIEILSPSTRRHDLMVKHSVLEEFGCSSYWVIDPDEPRLIAWELRDGKYVEVANVAGHDTWHATLPFPVTITPSALLD